MPPIRRRPRPFYPKRKVYRKRGKRYPKRAARRRKMRRLRRGNSRSVRAPNLSLYLRPFLNSPQTIYVKLYYTENLTLSSVVGYPASSMFLYRANSVYDPYYSILGKSVYGFSTLVALGYTKFTTLASKIKVTYASNKDTPVYNFLTTTTSSVIPTYTPTMLMNTQNIKYSYQPMRYSGPRSTLSSYSKMKNMLDADDDDEDVSHNATGNPATEWYYGVGYCNSQSAYSHAAGEVYCTVRIKYYVKCALKSVIEDK